MPMTSDDRTEAAARPHRVSGALVLVLGIVLIDTIGVLFALLLPALQALWSEPGIHVKIRNDGAMPIRSVVLHVTGASYELGDIEPKRFAQAVIHPTGESHLDIEISDAHGGTSRLNAGGYFEAGYQGTIDISIKDGAIDANEQNIRLR